MELKTDYRDTNVHIFFTEAERGLELMVNFLVRIQFSCKPRTSTSEHNFFFYVQECLKTRCDISLALFSYI